MTGFEDGTHSRTRRPGPVLASVFLVLLVLLGGAALILKRMAGPDAAAPAPTVVRSGRAEASHLAVACIQLGPPARGSGGDDYCLRVAEDIARRSPLKPEQATQLEDAARRIRVMLHDRPTPHTSCLPAAGPCTLVYAPLGPGDIGGIRSTLGAAGYWPAVMREARAADPAPPGDFIIAVAYGPGCVIAAYDPGGTGWQARTAGLLPDGTCLPA